MSLDDGCQRISCYRLTSLWALVLVLWTVEALAVTVSLSSSPPPETIRPDNDMAQVTLAVQQDGQPVQQGQLQVKVTAPPHPRLLSTDFPIVEATTLLDLASELQDGKFSFDYLFTLSGVYSFEFSLKYVV
jgi:hypothetical protein